MLSLFKKIFPSANSVLFKNSFWGLAGSIIQNLFLSLFYVLIARHYNIENFAEYIIANSLYQVIVAFSTMGLGQWFIREVVGAKDKNLLILKFLKMQTYFGIFFFLINILVALLLYDEFTVRVLSLLFAANIIFDNIIYSIKHVNIAEFAQKKSVSVLAIEAIAKFSVAASLFIYPFSIIWLVVLLVAIRFLTLNLFLKIGAAEGIVLKGFWKAPVPWSYVKSILANNWAFAVIGSLYVIYWKMDTLIISKMLSLTDVAHYENSFKIFSLAQLVPITVTATILPKFVALYKDGKHLELKALYRNIFTFYMLYGIGAYTFVYSFSADILPIIFGEKYLETSIYTKEMFLTILVFPTASLQAQVLIAMKLEKLDMLFNINSVLINTAICLIGLYFIKSLTVVNFAIFSSFLVFHLLQDVVLFRRKFLSLKEILQNILTTTILVVLYILLSDFMNPYLLYISFWVIVVFFYYIRITKNGLTLKI